MIRAFKQYTNGSFIGMLTVSATDMGKKTALALASRSLNFSIKSPASALASSYFLSVASASSYFKRGASTLSGFVLGFQKMARLRLASYLVSQK